MRQRRRAAPAMTLRACAFTSCHRDPPARSGSRHLSRCRAPARARNGASDGAAGTTAAPGDGCGARPALMSSTAPGPGLCGPAGVVRASVSAGASGGRGAAGRLLSSTSPRPCSRSCRPRCPRRRSSRGCHLGLGRLPAFRRSFVDVGAVARALATFGPVALRLGGGASAAASSTTRIDLAHLHLVTGVDAHLPDDAAHRRGHLDCRLVGFELEDRLVALQRVARRAPARARRRRMRCSRPAREG